VRQIRVLVIASTVRVQDGCTLHGVLRGVEYCDVLTYSLIGHFYNGVFADFLNAAAWKCASAVGFAVLRMVADP
jgi:hypothetical protein